MTGKISKRILLSKLVILLLWFYTLPIIFYLPYFYWVYAKNEGVTVFIMLGRIVVPAKAMVWPYYVFGPGKRDLDTSKNAVQWKVEERANMDHFFNGLALSNQVDKVGKEFTQESERPKAISRIIDLKKREIQEFSMVRNELLDRAYPGLSEKLKKYLLGLNLQIQGLESGDYEIYKKGNACQDDFSNWFGSIKDQIHIPKKQS